MSVTVTTMLDPMMSFLPMIVSSLVARLLWPLFKAILMLSGVRNEIQWRFRVFWVKKERLLIRINNLYQGYDVFLNETVPLAIARS